LLNIVNANHWTRQWLESQGLPEWAIAPATVVADLLLLAIIAYVADFVARKVLLSLIARWVKKSKSKWDDYFYQRRVFRNLAHLLPAIIVYNAFPIIFGDLPGIILFLQRFVQIYIIVLMVIVINKALRATEDLIAHDEKLVNSSLRTVSQVVRVLTFFVALVFIISVVTGIKAASLLGILAGTSAILILIFQDSIVGLLANFQITMYDLLRVGDWVTLNKYEVDGDVISIDLTTIKVRNFDKTISSVPAKAFVNDAFINWRGMKEEGARRIKRNILVDINSTHFVNDEEFEELLKIELVHDYIQKKQNEIDAYNSQNNVNTTLPVNGRRQTNIGIYRNYVLHYLNRHGGVDKNFPIMVRQLQPTASGIPIEVYCFAKTTVWEDYERIQADIFDHLFAATKYFSLRLYQAPSGRDLRYIGKDHHPER
jgi:miniconductance mechanosensitive channel